MGVFVRFLLYSLSVKIAVGACDLPRGVIEIVVSANPERRVGNWFEIPNLL